MERSKHYIRVNETLVEVTQEQYLCYYRGKRRMRYFEHDIKAETPIRDADGKIIGYTPAKEDSLERMMGIGMDFSEEQELLEDEVIRRVSSNAVHSALAKLSAQERELIEMLFFDEISERQAAAILGISQKGVNKRKHRALEALKKFIEI